MAKIEGVRVTNYRVLRDVALGKLWNTRMVDPLTRLTAVVGQNGVGKSSLLDAFGFLADCLKLGVEDACDARGRGGFDRIRSQGSTGPIKFEVSYRPDSRVRPIAYELAIDSDRSGRPFVSSERLMQRRKGQMYGQPFSFLAIRDGRGVVWKEDSASEEVALDNRRLGIAILGALRRHPRISSFRQFVESWRQSCFAPDAARSLPLAGPQRRLTVRGDNLANVVQFMERQHPARFKGVVRRIAGRVPGVERIDTERGPDGRLLLRFNDNGFQDPFYAQQVSDGTLKLLAYLLMLADPAPPPFICVKEPESGLHHSLLEVLVHEFRDHATKKRNASQILVTTYQPYIVDALGPKETWMLEKGTDGFATIRRASDDAAVESMVNEGLPLGSLWYSGYLD